MCGITGILNFNGESAPQDVLQEMTDVLSHRGPDGDGQFIDGGLGIGHRRLSVIDLTEAADQPMSTSDGRYIITYNGEVYNFRELRQELQNSGYNFHSQSDTEVVLNAFSAWGVDALSKFNGMFAFAVWDSQERQLTVARDRYGIKPLYYWFDGKTFLFASEVKALLQHPSIQASVDSNALLEYFTFQNIFSDRTLFQNIRMFPAGHWARISPAVNGELNPQQYWDYRFVEPLKPSDTKVYEEELQRLFVQAVKRQLVSDVPLGSYLSGGMDSGAITAIASQELQHLISVTGGFDMSSASGLEYGIDERQRAEALSYRFGTELYEVVLKAGDMERCISDLVWHLEDLRVGQCYPNYYVSRLASKFMKVVLAGTGGDELFGGYPWRYYRAASNNSYEEYIEKYYEFWQRLVSNKIIHKLFQPDIWKKIQDNLTIDIFRSVLEPVEGSPKTAGEFINRSLYLESKTFLHGLLMVEDKLSMAHSLETRVPFLDNDLVDFAMRLPLSTKLRELDKLVDIDENEPLLKQERYFQKTNDGKLILREMLKRHLPDDYVTGIKQGFSGPDGSWFRGDSLNYVRDLLLNRDARIYGMLRYDTVSELIQEHLEGKKNRRLLIWSLICFEVWLGRFIK